LNELIDRIKFTESDVFPCSKNKQKLSKQNH